jgi:Mn2+/Fe2+ NRAMP family transporter
MAIKPLPKIAGILGYIATVIGAASEAGLFTFIKHPYGAVLVAIGGFAALLSHSLTGTGGKPPVWQAGSTEEP